jgi:hypothetical protein
MLLIVETGGDIQTIGLKGLNRKGPLLHAEWEKM